MDWLRSFDSGKGRFLQYFEALKENYDADLQNIKEEKWQTGVTTLQSIQATFWECIKPENMGHKMVFAKQIAKLCET